MMSQAPARYYHGARNALKPGDWIEPNAAPDEAGSTRPRVFCSPELDEAIWEAELASGDGPARIYVVEPSGPVEPAASVRVQPGHPWMSCCSTKPLRVIDEVTEWPFYHGTRASLSVGELLTPGRAPNFGARDRETNYIYMTCTLDAAKWGAELADGDSAGRIYIVEPTGPIEEDPNLTNQKFRGNPTRSFRSQQPLRVIGEVSEWRGHSTEAIQAMKRGLEQLDRLGVEPVDD